MFIWARVNCEKQVPFVNNLIVLDEQLDNVTAGVRCNADEIGPHGRIVSLRPIYVHPNCYQTNDRCADHNGQADAFSDDFALRFGRRSVFVCHRITL